MNLRRLDLNLLLVFDAVYAERSITKAAQVLGLSQPAVSNALKRLRDHLDDPLFERVANSIEPTPEAHRLAPVLSDALRSIEGSLDAKTEFNPQTDQRVFKIIMPDVVESTIMHPLIRATMVDAPGISFRLLPIEPTKFTGSLESKSVDLAVFVTPTDDNHLRSAYLYSESVCAIVRSGHPILGKQENMSEDDFFAADWVAIASNLRRQAKVYRETNALGRTRRIVCTVQRIWSVPHMVANTDLVGLLPRNLAQSISKKLNTKVFELPFQVPEEDWYMMWHKESTNDPGHRWLRNAMRRIATQT